MSRVRKSCADHECRCVLCNCQKMVQAAVTLRLPNSYARFGSDIERHGILLPPGDLLSSVVNDEELFDSLHVSGRDDALAGLSLMLMLGRYCSVSVGCLDGVEA